MKKILYSTLALALLAACNNKPKDPKAELADLKQQQAAINAKIQALEQKTGGAAADSGRVIDVSVIDIKPGQFTNYVELQGKIDATDNVTAYPQAGGIITAIYAKVGQHVSRGQLLAQLDNSALRQQIAQAQAQLQLLQTVYQRQKNLWDQKIGTEVQFLQAKTNYEAGQKSIAALKEQAAMYTIKSPISGTVDQMDLKLGQAASPGATGIRVVNADQLKVKADVPESYASRVNTGDNVKVVVPDANDSLTTKVTYASRVIDPTSRSFAVEIRLPARKTLRPNMTATIKIADYSKNNALVVPMNTIQRSENGNYVFVEQNGVAKRKDIKLGASYGGNTEVVSGLNTGDRLITSGAADIEDGDRVRVASNQ